MIIFKVQISFNPYTRMDHLAKYICQMVRRGSNLNVLKTKRDRTHSRQTGKPGNSLEIQFLIFIVGVVINFFYIFVQIFDLKGFLSYQFYN